MEIYREPLIFFWAIEFDLKDFNGWKFQTKKVLHSNSQDFHYISFWLGGVFSRPSMSFWDFSPVSPIISPRLSPIPCLVETNHITRRQPPIEVCGFHRKCWRLSDFLGKKINVLSSLLLRDCHFWISAKIFCIFFPESVLWFCESLMNSVIARKVPFIFEAFRCMFDSHSLIFSYWIDFWL